MNETIAAIMGRRSIRKFEQKQVPEELLQEILEAGRSAPSGGNIQTSHLLVIQSREILCEMTELAVQRLALLEYDEKTYQSLRSAIERARKGYWDFTYGAPTFVIVANQKEYTHNNHLVDSACVIENMMIAAQSLGIGTCYINNLKWLNEDRVMLDYLRNLGLGEKEIPCGSLSMGYSAMKKELPPLKRTGNLVTRIG